MHRILLVTPDRASLSAFAEYLAESHNVQIAWAQNGQSAIADVMKHTPLGVVIDENLLDMTGFDLVRRLLPINAMINTVLISDLPHDAFHEASEGLGILAQLPPKPTPSDAGAVLDRFKKMSPSGVGFPPNLNG